MITWETDISHDPVYQLHRQEFQENTVGPRTRRTFHSIIPQLRHAGDCSPSINVGILEDVVSAMRRAWQSLEFFESFVRITSQIRQCLFRLSVGPSSDVVLFSLHVGKIQMDQIQLDGPWSRQNEMYAPASTRPSLHSSGSEIVTAVVRHTQTTSSE
jgi:hypothetical protein